MTTYPTGRLDIDRAAFALNFATSAMAIRHRLLDDPRMDLESLAQLASRHPSQQIEQNEGAVSEVASAADARASALSPDEVVRTIDTNGLWMVIKNIELDATYKGLLDELLDEVEPIVADREGGMRRREGFIFISAPNATTPSHTDPEHNFLLQIRGLKQMVVGQFPDDSTRQLEIENLSSGGHRNIDWTPVSPETFDLQPGDGVYVYPHAPHLVRNGPHPSISLSITWRTPVTERNRRASAVNHWLRRLRFDPAAPGERPRVDASKAEALRLLTQARRIWRRAAR